MHLNLRNIISRSAILLVASVFAAACSDVDLDFTYPDIPETESPSRLPSNDYRTVFIVYSMGFNNLTNYLKEDIEDILSNPLMDNSRDALLIFSHRANCYQGERYPRYSEATSPTLTLIQKEADGDILRDTLLVLPDTYRSSDASTMNEVLTYIRDNFKADSYGMLMSSHGTGWAPENYCNNPNKFDKVTGGTIWSARMADRHTPKPYLSNLSVDGLPAVKSIGVQNITNDEVTEMDITDLADAVPMKMDFIIFDACLMGGIEVAYELRKVCNKMVFSQTEILADGMDYKSMSSYIFTGAEADLKGFCNNYYEYYNAKSGTSQSATISLIDCTALEPLAEICREIFETHRTEVDRLEGYSHIQKYFRVNDHRWFFDLEDAVRNTGASQQQMQALDEALGLCVLHKAATEQFIGLPIVSHSGLSMYVPYKDRTYLNSFYKTLEWNKATGLVQ